ncbi:phytanoyl-CoA dioxygenase family protein [Phenylobacterium sp.]|uniref:phytanoyl-CoA dioxygenase family protein n=1 Tax=Phenylobacterium sp. TaxID=1871053 RepID=UPI002EDB3514
MAETLFGPPPGPVLDVSPTADDVAFFRANGFLAVERLTTDEEVDWLRRIFEHIFDPANAGNPGGPVDRSGLRIPEIAGKLTQSFFPEMQFPEILETNFRRNARRFAAALLDQDEAQLTSWGHMIRKAPGGPAASWHQDHAYWQPEFDYCALGVWLPMHDVSVEMGAMQFIPGSHRRGLLPHRQEDDPSQNVLMVDERAGVDLSTAVACPLKKGGCTFHHAETLHYTAPNTTDRPRLAFPMEFQLKPVRRAQPERMPWVDEHRAAIGGAGPTLYIHDGRITRL